ncbi:MAG: T9SS type A sorting domain-containing protein [Ignavibacteriota bacterium]
MKSTTYIFLCSFLVFGSSLISPPKASGQIWELANKTHRSKKIISGEGKTIFSISSRLFFSADLGKSFTVDEGSLTNNVSGFAVGSVGKYYFSSPMGLYNSPTYTDLNNEAWTRIDSTNVPLITSLYVRAGKGIQAEDEIYIGTASGLYRRSSLGLNWQKLHDAGDGLPILEITAFNNSIYYRTLSTAFSSADGGMSWKSISTLVSNGKNTGIIATSDNELYIAVSGFPGSHILHSTDGGVSFNGQHGLDFSSRSIQTFAISPIGDLYLGGGVRDDVNQDSITQGYAFVLSKPSDWGDFSSGLPGGVPPPEVIGFGFAANGSIFAATDSAGLYRSTSPNKVAGRNTAEGLRLGSAYPNPANTFTDFSITADNQAQAEITVVNSLGKTVLSLQKNSLDPGINQFRIGTQSLADGIYFIRVQTNASALMESFIVRKK